MVADGGCNAQSTGEGRLSWICYGESGGDRPETLEQLSLLRNQCDRAAEPFASATVPSSSGRLFIHCRDIPRLLPPLGYIHLGDFHG
jgi:hypothetical protein